MTRDELLEALTVERFGCSTWGRRKPAPDDSPEAGARRRQELVDTEDEGDNP